MAVWSLDGSLASVATLFLSVRSEQLLNLQYIVFPLTSHFRRCNQHSRAFRSSDARASRTLVHHSCSLECGCCGISPNAQRLAKPRMHLSSVNPPVGWMTKGYHWHMIRPWWC